MPTAPFKQAEELLGDSLRSFIEDRRKRVPRFSWDRISRELYMATDGRVDVNGETVRRWWNGGEAA